MYDSIANTISILTVAHFVISAAVLHYTVQTHCYLGLLL